MLELEFVNLTSYKTEQEVLNTEANCTSYTKYGPLAQQVLQSRSSTTKEKSNKEKSTDQRKSAAALIAAKQYHSLVGTRRVQHHSQAMTNEFNVKSRTK